MRNGFRTLIQSASNELIEMASAENPYSSHSRNSTDAEQSPGVANRHSRRASDLDVRRDNISDIYPDLGDSTHLSQGDAINVDDWCPSSVHLNLLLQKNGGKAEHLLGNLHSLVHIPLSQEVGRDALYGFYHRSLFDSLKDPDRCGPLHAERGHSEFIWDRVLQVYTKSVNCSFGRDPYPENFLQLFFSKFPFPSYPSGFYSVQFTPPVVDWWASGVIARSKFTPNTHLATLENILRRSRRVLLESFHPPPVRIAHLEGTRLAVAHAGEGQ